MLIFEKVFEESANIIYAWGRGRTQKPDFMRLKVKVIPGTKTKVKFSVSYADYTFTLEDSKTLSGICERRSGPPFRTTLKKIE